MLRSVTFKNAICIMDILFGVAVLISRSGTPRFVLLVIPEATLELLASVMVGAGAIGLIATQSPMKLWVILSPMFIYMVLALIGMTIDPNPAISAIVLLVAPFFLTWAVIIEWIIREKDRRSNNGR